MIDPRKIDSDLSAYFAIDLTVMPPETEPPLTTAASASASASAAAERALHRWDNEGGRAAPRSRATARARHEALPERPTTG